MRSDGIVATNLHTIVRALYLPCVKDRTSALRWVWLLKVCGVAALQRLPKQHALPIVTLDILHFLESFESNHNHLDFLSITTSASILI